MTRLLRLLSMFLGLVTLVAGAIFMMQSMLSINKSSDLDKTGKFDTSSVNTSLYSYKSKMSAVVNIKEANLYAHVIPKEITALAENVKISNNKIKVLDRDMFYREALPPNDDIKTNQNVLLLHGMNFKSQTWLELGTITLLAAMGHRVVAVDLPGYGETGGDQYDADKKGDFLNEVIVKLQLHSPFVVSPSMSGSFSLPYIFKYPGKMGAYIPVAPIFTDKYTKKQYETVETPALIIYGALDSQLGELSAKNLRQIPNSQEQILPDARHPAYLDKPEMFHQLLYNLLLKLKN